MNPDSSNSASSTATTSTTAPQTPHDPDGGAGREKPGGPMSEAEFLQRQAEDARQALSAVFGELSRNLRDGVDPKLWTKEHPWAMVAGATVAGFAAAAMFVPSKDEQALRRLARIEKALMPKRPLHEGSENGHHEGDDAGAKDFSRGRSSFLSAIGRQVLEAVKPALMSALTAGITAKAAQPETPQQAGAQPIPPGGTNPDPGDPSSAI